MAGTERLQDILDYWHKIEFFIPFDMKQVFEQVDKQYLIWLKPADLSDPTFSPWRIDLPKERELTGFRLYLGIFDMQAIADFARRLSECDATDSVDDDERTELDGVSCMAKVFLDVHGQPVFNPFSISTVPWALGVAGRHGLAALGSGAFDAARSDLSERLFNFEAGRRRRRSDGSDDAGPVPLTGRELMSLQALLVEWAGCDLPPHSSVALLEFVTREKRKSDKCHSGGSEAVSGGAASPRAESPQAHDPDGDDEEGDDAADAPTVDILNSFYIEDIERCLASVREGIIPVTIREYLTTGDADRRIDLYSGAGRAEIVRALHPRKMNAGHWPEDASRKMSLMQQFAINTAFEKLKLEGLFSVNGPPGTGKTTLLRDMVCENVVRRARRLSRLAVAADALAKTGTKVRFLDGNTATIRALHPDLTGFEMVVASSNNAAVENISADLPKRKQLGDAWREVRYLQPVAHKVAAQAGERSFTKLQPLDVPWGLISCALGNAKNRRRFRERFFDDWRPDDERGSGDDPCAIRDWLKRYSGPTFHSAKRVFLDMDASIEAALEARMRYAELHAAWSDVTEAQFTQQAADALAQATRSVHDATAASTQVDAALQAANAELADLKEDERLLDRAGPGFLAKLLGLERARRHAADVARNARAQIDARKRVAQCRTDIVAVAEAVSRAHMQAERAEAALTEARSTWREKQALLAEGKQRFAGMDLPGPPDRVESDAVQRDGFWQDAELAQLRSRLFVAALALHEAWLAEVAQTGGPGFGGNLFAISKLLGGARLENPTDAVQVWQSLFMVVPVVSSTFASFARQFRGMGPGSIGWLFIDEAGQAVPQAAVGALWRARRTMVVGDPLQIEPVFTVPTTLINALADLSPHTLDGRYSPAKVSVQRLADDANPFGTHVAVDGEEPLWIGSPLRVHRRCADPMFTIANRIAYHDKMVFGLESRNPSDDPIELGDSAWVDVRGKTADRQMVPLQIDVVAELIVKLYARSGTLPPLYVISPFKAVKRALLNRLQEIDWEAATGRQGPKRTVWERWRKARIGTVHTFQGKEESTVIFVLGADHDSAGSASWASSRPNLLNVAVTRAQHRLFVVGDASLWGRQAYFSDALSALGTPITSEQWLGRIGAAAKPTRTAVASTS
ncbi:DEAD/DEAH box helicase [Burkholderia ubonensis]|uniref:DEAD/DEAH box helicase n=1 Tax=Burkholderia ubonensis TaxID=101571 RepID=UPI00075A388D|nr:AAA domain-containing protein [Burkholderia ubonensis]KVG75036.1 hypothetical protein WJ34_11860 [Burkholderia ubonensis]KVH19803.1 hypothetical protein WJ37_19125 [Burkholderia ubonensis]KVH50172.1 hypothetical protein WJ38_12540 [Burkholderia ubonensis]KVH87187.1 hypothetical protein WJ43_01935 [Burkholderia ubonensis]KVM37634.1 hypothetical protein WJ55_09935 [Burkholderia ubonensis]